MLDHIALTTKGRPKKRRLRKERAGGGEAIIRGARRYFKRFRKREAIIRGRRLIEGWLLFEEIRYLDVTKSSRRNNKLFSTVFPVRPQYAKGVTLN